MKLDDYLDSISLHFDWRTNNCCHFAARWVKANTGRDWMADLPATGSLREAIRLKEALGGPLERIVSNCLGQPIPVASARAGDVVRLAAIVGDDVQQGVETLSHCPRSHAS